MGSGTLASTANGISAIIQPLTIEVPKAHGNGTDKVPNPLAGTYTVTSSGSLDRWNATESGTTITLSCFSGEKPSGLIIGPIDGSGKYSAANSSIIEHNPVVLETATFTITVPGVTSSSTLDTVSIGFGTTGSGYITASRSPSVAAVPEPSAYLAGLGALGMLSMFGWRNRKSRVQDLP